MMTTVVKRSRVKHARCFPRNGYFYLTAFVPRILLITTAAVCATAIVWTTLQEGFSRDVAAAVLVFIVMCMPFVYLDQRHYREKRGIFIATSAHGIAEKRGGRWTRITRREIISLKTSGWPLRQQYRLVGARASIEFDNSILNAAKLLHTLQAWSGET